RSPTSLRRRPVGGDGGLNRPTPPERQQSRPQKASPTSVIHRSTAMASTPGMTTDEAAGMKYANAVQATSAVLAQGGDPLAAAGAVDLAMQAWRDLAGADAAWDYFGLGLLEVCTRLYPHRDVAIHADPPPSDGPTLRGAVADLIEELARYHEREAANTTLNL